jgi:hypothetical protein
MKFSDYLIKLAQALQPSRDQFDIGDLVVIKDEFTGMGERQELYVVSGVDVGRQVTDDLYPRATYDRSMDDQIDIITVNQRQRASRSGNGLVAVDVRRQRVSRNFIRHATFEEIEKLNELHEQFVRSRFLKGVQKLYGQVPTAGVLKDAGRFDTVKGLNVQVESAFKREKVLAVVDSVAPKSSAGSIEFDELQFRKYARKMAKESIKAFRKGTLDQVVEDIPSKVEFDGDGHSFATLVLLRNDITGERMEYLLGSFMDRKEFQVLINPGEWTTMVTVTVCVHEKFSTRLYVNP